MTKTICTWLLATSLLLPTVTVAVPNDVIERAWRPPVELTGQGNADLAVSRLRDYVSLQRLMMDHTEYHQQTQSFVDDLWGSLESFDLEGFYRLLPEEQAQWRQLRVFGAADRGVYRIGPEPLATDAASAGWGLGDFEARIRAQEIDASSATHYLLNGNLELGLGGITWPSMVQATRETLRLMAENDPSFSGNRSVPAERYRSLVRSMNPQLDPREVEVLAPLWAAYPDMWNLIAGLGQVEGLLVSGGSHGDHREVAAVFMLDPDRLRHAYPSLSEYLDQLDNLLQFQLRVYDDHGQLMSLAFDTETLRGRLAMSISDGQVLPTRHGKPITDSEPFDPKQPKRLTVRLNSQMNILGIIANVQGMTAQVDYLPTATGARFEWRIQDVPGIRVGGRALGMVPPDLIDVFIPQQIDELIVDFLTVACKGNNGNGIAGSLELKESQDGESARLNAEGSFEGLDNFLVRVGMRIVNNRIIPNARVSDELRQLVYDAHEAFSRDLDQFERVSAVP
ncbi:hypothetical protein [Marinobacter sp. SS21]|uniref:hypothetical protein n=1 Tax=Marinobacter sp. SS21 TaxID=2979460 RepID=UPI002330033C|nr:hypothetical protein [Marinobacter sp. SS21]MDC0661530.1 hypothetical protein [Marinobacter sp. SS21]